MAKHEVLDRHARNNRFGGYPEHMEDYRLANGYEWRDGLLQPKVDPRSLNDHGIPTNDFNLPAQPGLNMLPLNARTQTRNRYLDQFACRGWLKASYDDSTNLWFKQVPFIQWGEDVNLDMDFEVRNWDGNPWVAFEERRPFVPQEYFKPTIIGKIDRKIKNGELIIPQDGSYIIHAVSEVYYWPEHNVANDMGKCFLNLMVTSNKLKSPATILLIAKYTISFPECLYGTTVQSLQAGDRLTIHYGYKTTRHEKIGINTTLNIIKL